METINDLSMVEAFRNWQHQSRLLESIQIAFLLGPPKTGTSWVTTILHSHPNAIARGEGHFPTRLIPALKAAMENYGQAQIGMDRIKKHKGPAPWTIPDSNDMVMLARQMCDRMFLHYIGSVTPGTKERIVVVADKTPDNARHVRLLNSLYPWAKFICITRDVRDAAVSSYFHRKNLGQAIPFDSIDDFAPAYARDVWGPMMWLARRAARQLGCERYTEIHYEQCKNNPHETVTRLFAFLGLDHNASLVETCIEATSFEKQSGRKPGQEKKDFLRKGIVGDWKNHLSPDGAQRTLDQALAILSKPFEPDTTQNALTNPVDTCTNTTVSV